MSSQFHNRLVGTVVLVALGVIFLPDILDGKKDRQEEQFSEIPLRPTVIEQQKADDDMFEVLSAEDAAALNGTEVALAEMPVNADNEKSVAAPVIEVAKQDVKKDVKPDVKKAEPKPETKPEAKKEPPKATVKTEPAKKADAKATTVAKAEKPKAETPKASAAKEDAVKVVSRDSLKSGFTLQLGSFNNATNVKALVAQLRKSGFKAYTIPENPKDGVLTKVFVGPDVSEAKLKKVQVEVENLTRLKGWIVPFNPLES
ncbi:MULTISPECIES: SPOR domain-containing protein [unclassified Shewanella]|uniref:SPOR domain-containing protein n=1 Tax=Shewanella TaxID=22 RepID=UPI0021DAC76A|nr:MULTISPECIES: SPOR domain-containing protein [unclassified Shewanella]MCU8008237.1 SPOR domain-containing protein [Shewanella sp. SM87]MCU8020532.1 SPOR domain-containing protein [Shewanella sp. SM78]MCU8044464.1 SPOR domain-containing protein [Shewanella sp. SM68]MCU8048546.1 SPOR domain-containing protein [Shewanella sp. SM65]MCU8074469.1 SPOR domain-containing protein [Shewanella sp. SM29]